MSELMDYYSGVDSNQKTDARVRLIRSTERKQTYEALNTPPPAPNESAPVNGSLDFIPNSDPSIIGYAIYRSVTNSADFARRVGFVPQPPDTSLPLKFSDSTQLAGTYYYWVSSVNSGKGESTRIGLGAQTIVGQPTPDSSGIFYEDSPVTF